MKRQEKSWFWGVSKPLVYSTLWAFVGVCGAAVVDKALPAATALEARVQESYGQLPLSFEANQGQTDAQVKFLAHGPGYALFLTPTEAVLSLKKPQAQPTAARKLPAPSEPAGGTVLRMQLVGANPAPQIAGRERLPGKVNYLKGKDPAHWHTEIPTYAKVAYAQVYPGVDLVYYGNPRQLEYDFRVAPGADPQVITLGFAGVEKLRLAAGGELVLHTKGGEVRMPTPVVYQEIEGVKQPVAGHYVLKDNHQVGFEMVAYDTSKPLVIDPFLLYSTYLGGSSAEDGNGIAVDRFNQAHVTGGTTSADFPTSSPVVAPPLQEMPAGGFDDAFVAKLNPSGTALIYSTYLGGSGDDLGRSIAVDFSGQAYVTGHTTSTNFPTKNPLQGTNGGLDDAFVAKLNPSGTALIYSTYLGGSSAEGGTGIAVDRFNQAHVTGDTTSADFPTASSGPTPPLQETAGGSSDAFVAKLNPSGTALNYSTYHGGSGDDLGRSIAVDFSGQAYVTGDTTSTDFPIKNPLQGTSGGPRDAFVAKLHPRGTALIYSTYLGGSGGDGGWSIAVDFSGHAYVTGRTVSNDFPTKNPQQRNSGGVVDAFVAKIHPGGTNLIYSTYLGGSGDEIGEGIAVDRFGRAFLTGETTSSNFPTVNPLQGTLRGRGDAFVALLNQAGNTLSFSTYLGGRAEDSGSAIAVDLQLIFGPGVYVTGTTFSGDFPTNTPAQPTSGGFSDAFVTKISLTSR